MIPMEELGRNVASARKQAKLTQAALARRAGVSLPTIVLLENGRARELGYSKIVRILAAVGLELRLHRIAPARPTLEDLLKEDSADD